jgi:hypothetical protein
MRFPRPKAGPVWLTLLDAALLLSASAALVSLLGEGIPPELLGARVTSRAATRLFFAIALLALVRVWLGGSTRPVPSLAAPDRLRFERERARFAAPEPWTRHVTLCAAATLLGSLIWIVPHLLAPRRVPDAGDPLFSAWRIARLAHQLVTDPSHLFDGNIFHPLPLTMTLSDTTFLQAMLGLPFVLSGVDPLLVANGLTMIAFPVCGLAFFYAGWRMTGDPDAGLIAGLLGAWYPFHAEHYSHLELQWLMFAPLAVVTGMRMLADPRVVTGLWFGAAIAAQWLASMYFGVMLLTFLVPFLVIVALAWRTSPNRRAAVALGTAALVSLPAFGGLAVPYLQAREIRGERTRQEVVDYSAVGSDYGRPHQRLTTYRWLLKRDHRPERELFPGTSTLVLAAAGAVPPMSAATIAALAGGALTFDWSLGLNGLTYDELHALSPAHRGMRVAARYSAIVGVALVLLGAVGTARLLRRIRSSGLRAAATAALALIVLFDLRMDPGLESYPEELPSIYSRVTSDMVLVELPIHHQIDYMYFSTSHWARLVGGNSGFIKYSDALIDSWKAWPAPESIEFFRKTGATHLTYNCALEDRRPWRCAIALEMLDAHPGLERLASGLWEGKDTRLYRIK